MAVYGPAADMLVTTVLPVLGTFGSGSSSDIGVAFFVHVLQDVASNGAMTPDNLGRFQVTELGPVQWTLDPLPWLDSLPGVPPVTASTPVVSSVVRASHLMSVA